MLCNFPQACWSPTCLIHMRFSLPHIFFSQILLWIPREGSRKVTKCIEDTDATRGFRERGPLTSREAIPLGSHPKLTHFLAVCLEVLWWREISFFHQEALWATSAMFISNFDAGLGFIEMLVFPVLWLDSRAQFQPQDPDVVFIVYPRSSYLSKNSACVLIWK